AMRAMELAVRLDRLNRERREIEAQMQESALALVGGIRPDGDYTLCVHHPEWHGGVVGILASRLKDRFHRPVFAFAADREGRLKGSGRSIAGLHLRDALDLMAKRSRGLLERFGGHAGAAGATIAASALDEFRAGFEAVARETLTAADLSLRIETDGALPADDIDVDFARTLRGCVWGQG